MTPTPAGPKIIETTMLESQGNSILKIKFAAKRATTPRTLLTIIFFKKKKINTVAITKTIAGIIYSGGRGITSVATS